MSSLGGKVSFFVSCIIITVMTIIGGIVNKKILIIGFALLILYLATSFLSAYLRQRSQPHKEASTIITTLNDRFFSDIDLPLAVIGEEDDIVVSNAAFEKCCGHGELHFRDSVETFTGGAVTYSKLISSKKGDSLEIPIYDKIFSVSTVPVDLGAKEYCITLWTDVTERNRLRLDIKNKNTLIAMIVVDNSTEISQNVQENYRSASATVSRILDEWAASFNAFIKEYERDKYIMTFNEEYLESMTSDRFGILDDIRRKTEDELGVPLTVSIGISRLGNTLSEKAQSSAQALGLALQRGGDQAVVKNESDTLFFGGRTRTMQKLTKIRSRIIANQLVALMKRADKVLVMGHRFADHDSIGSCIGIARIAMSTGKSVNIIVNRDDENLKLVFRKMQQLHEYDDIFVDKITGQDMLTPDTLLVIVDVNNVKLYESESLFDNAQTVAIIDHHRKTGEFNKPIAVSYIEPSASSASELVCELLEQTLPPNSILKDEAEMLLSGIILDTKNFTSNAGVRTFSAAMYLRGEGADPRDAQLLFKASYNDYMRQVRFIKNTYVFREDIVIAYSDHLASEKDKIVAAKLADTMLNMEGMNASFVLCNVEGTIHISARSTGTINVQLILEHLHGGGRYDNAGAQLPDTDISTALKLLEGAIDLYLSQEVRKED